MKAGTKASKGRILLALDSASDNRNALQTAVLLAARLEAERDIRGFDVRVGINTGLVVVGEVGTVPYVADARMTLSPRA